MAEASRRIHTTQVKLPLYCDPVDGGARLSSDVSEIKIAFGIPPERPTPNFAASWNARQRRWRNGSRNAGLVSTSSAPGIDGREADLVVLTSETRLIDRIHEPSQSIARFWTRLVRGNRFIDRVYKLLPSVGPVCIRFHDAGVRDAANQRIQCDEAWVFCYSKQNNVATARAAPEGAGEVWTRTTHDAHSKLILLWAVGGRDADYASRDLNLHKVG
jgi:hypothetical protein